MDAARLLAWLFLGGASVLAAGCALVPLAVGRAGGQPLLAGLPMLLVGLVLLGAALAAAGRTVRQVAAGLLVPLLAAALLRPVAELRAGLLLVAAALVAAALAGAVPLLPERFRAGPRVGALVVAGGLAQVGALITVGLAGDAVSRSLPAWRAGAAGPALSWGWQLPVAVALTAAAVAVLLPRAARPVTALLGVALTAAALPAVAVTPWPATLAIDLVVGVALLLVAVGPGRRNPTVLVGALAAAALVGHGLLVGCAEPVGLLVALGVVAAAGAVAALRAGRGSAVQRGVAGVALAVALLAVPAGVVVALFAAGAPPWWQLRGGLAAAALLLAPVVALRRHRPDLDGYASTALAVALAGFAPAPLVVPGGEPVTLYAAVAVLVLALADRREEADGAVGVVGVGLAGLTVLAAAPAALAALVPPYGGVARPWSGAPGVEPVPGAPAAGVALLVLAVAAALVAGRLRGGRATSVLAALPFGAAALPVLLVAAAAPWPVVPAAVLLTGVSTLLAVALADPGSGESAAPAGAAPASGGRPAAPGDPGPATAGPRRTVG
ncbi:hypothetical protein V6U80_29505, partial [Micromonospora sp. CPCC 205543]